MTSPLVLWAYLFGPLIKKPNIWSDSRKEGERYLPLGPAFNRRVIRATEQDDRRSAVAAAAVEEEMIKAVMVINTQGKPRLAKFYEHQTVDKQRELIRKVFSVLSCRAENVSNFMEADSIFGPDSHLVYKHFATLYFVFVFDSSENELAMLDLIQVFVETLDKCFKNVCELDIVFNYEKMQTIIDEMIFGGQVLEVNSAEIMRAVEEISKLEAASNAISLVPKSVSGWRSR